MEYPVLEESRIEGVSVEQIFSYNSSHAYFSLNQTAIDDTTLPMFSGYVEYYETGVSDEERIYNSLTLKEWSRHFNAVIRDKDIYALYLEKLNALAVITPEGTFHIKPEGYYFSPKIK